MKKNKPLSKTWVYVSKHYKIILQVLETYVFLLYFLGIASRDTATASKTMCVSVSVLIHTLNDTFIFMQPLR